MKYIVSFVLLCLFLFGCRASRDVVNESHSEATSLSAFSMNDSMMINRLRTLLMSVTIRDDYRRKAYTSEDTTIEEYHRELNFSLEESESELDTASIALSSESFNKQEEVYEDKSHRANELKSSAIVTLRYVALVISLLITIYILFIRRR